MSTVAVGRKPCGCPTFASVNLSRKYNPPRNGYWTRGTWGRWIDTEQALTMSRVPADQANLVICRCDVS